MAAMEITAAFKVLCVREDATVYEVKRAYRKAALAVHPDKPGGSAALFRRVAEAYEVCLDFVESVGASTAAKVEHAEPWARAARWFPGYEALSGAVSKGTADEPYDFL